MTVLSKFTIEIGKLLLIEYDLTQSGQKRRRDMVCDIPLPAMIKSISEAKAHFSAIVDEASGGKTFVICRAGRPLVTVSQYIKSKPTRRPDQLKGKIRIADDFDALPEGFAEAFA